MMFDLRQNVQTFCCVAGSRCFKNLVKNLVVPVFWTVSSSLLEPPHRHELIARPAPPQRVCESSHEITCKKIAKQKKTLYNTVDNTVDIHRLSPRLNNLPFLSHVLTVTGSGFQCPSIYQHIACYSRISPLYATMGNSLTALNTFYASTA